jgi:hypothetical protein
MAADAAVTVGDCLGVEGECRVVAEAAVDSIGGWDLCCGDMARGLCLLAGAVAEVDGCQGLSGACSLAAIVVETIAGLDGCYAISLNGC